MFVLRREVIPMSIVMIAIVVAASTVAQADFDWRNVGGSDYMTPVKNQNPAGTCWAFAAVGALEAKFDIYNSNPNLNLNLSEQHLVCDGSMGGIGGGWEYMACDYFRTDGIVDEATLPYTAQNTSPLWPLTPPYNLHGITANQNWIGNSTANVKSQLQSDGPLVAAILVSDDWYWPTTPNGTTDVPDFYDETGTINHAIVVAGFVDDAQLQSDGYWIIKNSWGTGWGDSGYGYVKYGVLEGHNRIHALTGDPFVTFVPVPGAVLLGMFGLSVAGIKLRKFA